MPMNLVLRLLLALAASFALAAPSTRAAETASGLFCASANEEHTYFVGELGAWVHNNPCTKTPSPKVKDSPFGTKVADEVPTNGVPKNWTNGQIGDAIATYSASIAARTAELAAFDARGGGSATQRLAHARRVTVESAFLRSLENVYRPEP